MALGFIALSVIFISACKPNSQQKVIISGSSTVLPIIASAAEQFRSKNPDVQLIINAGGSGTGINQLGREQVDIGMMSRDIHASEYKQFKNKQFTKHKIARDAVLPAISSEIFETGVDALSREQIALIYKGEISNWAELGGPDKEILVIDKEASRGTRQVFMDYVLGDKDAIAAGADLVLGSNNEEQTALVQSDAAIGMLSLAWLNNDVRGLNLVLENHSVVEPSLTNIINNKFPIVRELVVVTGEHSSPQAHAFIRFLQSANGQSIVEETGYIALSSAQ